MSLEHSLLNFFVLDEEIKNTCDFNPYLLKEGPSIYEVFRVIDGTPLFLDEHIERFYQSADLENIALPKDHSSLRHQFKALIDYNKLQNGNIRFQAVKTVENRTIFMAWVTQAIYPTREDYKQGVRIVSLNEARDNPHSKRANLPVRDIAEEIIAKEQVAEVLLINEDGLVTECHRSNIFFTQGETLLTPSEKLVLQGITRERIMNLAVNNGIKCEEIDVRLENVTNFDSCFISSTSKNVLPVHTLDSLKFKVSSPLVRRLSELLDKNIADHLQNFKW